MFDLTGMTALVTGASGGIGSAICQALAAQGARLAVSGSNVDKLEAFRASLGGDHVAVPCDLGDKDSVEALVPAALEKLGQIDILVNNAGVTRDNLTMRMKDEEWGDVISINLEATFRLMRAATKPMMKSALWPDYYDHQRRWHHGQSRPSQLRSVERWPDSDDKGHRAGACQP